MWREAALDHVAQLRPSAEAVRPVQPREAEPHPQPVLLEVKRIELTAAPHLGSSSFDEPFLRGFTRGAAVNLVT